MKYYDEIRDEACGYLEREITDAEWAEALSAAQRKLDRIISLEGDHNGERRKPYYLGKLIAEYLIQKAFANYCDFVSVQNLQKRRIENETVPA